jgi:hypothetical protein
MRVKFFDKNPGWRQFGSRILEVKKLDPEYTSRICHNQKKFKKT